MFQNLTADNDERMLLDLIGDYDEGDKTMIWNRAHGIFGSVVVTYAKDCIDLDACRYVAGEIEYQLTANFNPEAPTESMESLYRQV